MNAKNNESKIVNEAVNETVAPDEVTVPRQNGEKITVIQDGDKTSIFISDEESEPKMGKFTNLVKKNRRVVLFGLGVVGTIATVIMLRKNSNTAEIENDESTGETA